MQLHVSTAKRQKRYNEKAHTITQTKGFGFDTQIRKPPVSMQRCNGVLGHFQYIIICITHEIKVIQKEFLEFYQ